ncbi:Fructose-bisphosphate aldolase 1 [Apophysomyces sp. BC1015]|nr:Fructose-bisphosphate aldolase 1 [Apophysomyces sp. BC1015]
MLHERFVVRACTASLSRLVSGVLALGGLIAALIPGAALADDAGKVRVLYAGSLVHLMERCVGPAFEKESGLKFSGYGAGSNKLANELKGKLRRGDVFISASPEVNASLGGASNGNLVSWYVNFGESPLLLGYNVNSRFAAALKSERWDKVLLRPGVRIGRTDPKLDPKGAFTLEAVTRAASLYMQPNLVQRMLGAPDNPDQVLPEETLVGRLQSGQLDVGFFYATETAELHIPTVKLPAELAVKASYTITILNGAPNQDGAVRFVTFLLGPKGRTLLRDAGIDVIAPSVGGERMRRSGAGLRRATPLGWLAALLALYLCAPFVAVLPQLTRADWHAIEPAALADATMVSVGSATFATLLIALTGIPLGYLLSRSRSRWASALGFVVQLPLALPPLSSGVLLLFLLGPYSALGTLAGGGLTDSFAGVVLAQTFVAAPFLIVAARSAFDSVDPVLDDVAATLGHGAHTRFMRVWLPIAWPSIRAGMVLAWLRAFGEFGATVMVAYHPYSLPVYTYVVFGSVGLPAMLPLLAPTLVIALALPFAAATRLRPSRHATAPGPAHELEPLRPVAREIAPAPRHAARGVLAFHFECSLGDFALDIQWRPRTRRLAIVGPSGSGKSITLRMIAGLQHGATQSVIVDGEVLTGTAPQSRHVAYVPQDYGLFPHMTVARQLAFAADADASATRYWSLHLGIAQLAQRVPAQLSLGQRQRVALARALARDARVILLDEPFSALDTPRRRALRDTLRVLQREIDAITVLVTHDPDDAALLADEILVLDRGRVLQKGATHELFERPANLKVAQLLGIDNVGEGTLVAGDRVDIGGVLLGVRDGSLSAGTRLMWRVDARGVTIGAHGQHPGVIERVYELHGETRVAVRVGAVLLHCRASSDASADGAYATPHMSGEGQPCCVDIATGSVTVWPVTS